MKNRLLPSLLLTVFLCAVPALAQAQDILTLPDDATLAQPDNSLLSPANPVLPDPALAQDESAPDDEDDILAIPDATTAIQDDAAANNRTAGSPTTDETSAQNTLPTTTAPAAEQLEGTPQKPLIFLDEEDTAPKQPVVDINAILTRLENLPPELQDELMDESARMESYCSKNFMLKNFYDCTCFSIQFINERITAGPDVHFTNIIGGNNFAGCASPALAAGYAFKRCHTFIYLERLSEKTINDVCRCTAQGVANSYGRSPVMRMNLVDNLFMTQLMMCRRQYNAVPRGQN